MKLFVSICVTSFAFIGCSGIGTAKAIPSQAASVTPQPSPSPNPSPNPSPSPSPSPLPSNPGYGLNIDWNEQSFANFIQPSSGNFSAITGVLPGDAQGWPTQDFQWFMDNRYVFGWVSGAVNIDPLKSITDLSGAYALSFTGQATLAGFGGVTISNQNYNSGTNTTTAQINIPVLNGDNAFFGVKFTSTKRTSASAAGTGATNVKIIRPGSSATDTFTEPWLHQTRDFNWAAFRFMGAMGTNDYNEAYPTLLNWSTDRALPGYGPLYKDNHVGVHGPPWEYVVTAAQQTGGKDIWINVPVNASDAYITSLATLMHNGLSSTQNLYVEYSNEMWHTGFPQGNWNKSAAVAEVNAGTSNLNYDNINNQDMWRLRRIAKRTVEIGRLFKQVFSDRPARIRPVINNAWPGFYPDMLNYVKANYGPPANDLYAISMTGYYTSSDASSVSAILNGEMANSDVNKASYLQTRTIATFYGLHSLVYEGGEGETANVMAASPLDPTLAIKFNASRDPGMQQVLTHDLLTNWYPSGGELYMQFSQVGRYSVYGFWGLSDDLNNISNGKWNGAKQVLSANVPAAQPGVMLPSTVGASVNLSEAAQPGQNWTLPADQPWLELLVNAPASGIYAFQVMGKQVAAGTLAIWVDGAQVGTTALGSSDALSLPVNLNLTAGLHAIFVYGPGTAGPSGVVTVPSDAAVIKRVQ